MAWFKCGGGGIPAALKSAMNTVFNKKFGTATTYQPDGWPDNVNLMGPLEEKTVSGSVVAFSDGADAVLLKSCAVTIAPTLDGVSSVDVVKTGKNLLNDSIRGRNVSNIYFGHDTGTQNDFSVRLRAGTYTFSVVTADGTLTNLYVKNSDTNTNITGFPAYNALSKTFTLSEDTNCAVYVYKSGYTDVTDILTAQIEAGSTATTYEQYQTPTIHTANLGRTIHGGSVDVVNGTGTDENGNDFTFPAVPILSRIGDNTMWGDGDLSVVYRSSGTQTIITPTLVSKTITANGTYTASDEGADGYDEVTVNVSGGVQNIETVKSSQPLIEITGVSGTDVSRTMWTRTAAQAETVVFHPNTQVKTNTGSNDGYFKVLKNDVVVASTYANTSTTTPLSIPDIDLEAGDVLTISAGFDNNHTSCWFDLFSTITILSSGSSPVLGLGLGNPGPVNEPEQEEEPDAAPEDPEEIQEETPEEVDQNESNE